ncbi:hypothetical protein PR202_gb05232 [Eleusine coracana subsp. coracana]|uniref:CASP-like protein n=1 Tax=Eleusine coracana subsp. coracana TaxID=191504 RepID=A0AAV5E5N9_ELECO|nr:hypothetical protein PR202_gb05232 [Eleusine coracana subsp. coracana]
MKNMVGSPGTWSGLVLRVLQFVCAAASLSVEAMSSAYAFKRYIAFVYLTSSMAWQLVYSLICCCLDIYALRTELDLHNPVFVWPMVITDWVSHLLDQFYCL